jgi:hypothetical protein
MNQFPDHYEVQAMHEKGKKKARYRLTVRPVRQPKGNIGPAASDPLVGDQEIQVENRARHTKKAPFGAL